MAKKTVSTGVSKGNVGKVTKKPGQLKSITTMSVVPVNEQEPKYIEFFGMDSTAIQDISFVPDSDSNEETYQDKAKEWSDRNKKTKSQDKKKVILDGIELVRSIVAETNREINLFGKTVAERAIIIGMICNELKPMVKETKEPWGVWADKNIPFLAKRNREKYMMIAQRTDCHKFAFLGIDRLEMLCSASKSSSGKDPINEFFKKYNITYAPKGNTNLQELKSKIDAAINSKKLQKMGLSIDFDLLISLYTHGLEVNSSLIRTLKNIKDSKGNTTRYLEDLIKTGGKVSVDDETKNAGDFSKLSNRLIPTIEFLIKKFQEEKTQIEDFDSDTLAKLLEKLEDLKLIVKPTSNEKPKK